MSQSFRMDETGAAGEERRTEFRSYVRGYIISLLLTLTAFALVAWSGMFVVTLGWIIGITAVAQIAVQLRSFLHIRFRGQAKEDLQLILFATLLLVLMAGGTIWILFDLADRMM